STCGEHDSLRPDGLGSALMANADAGDAAIAVDERQRPGLVSDLDPVPARRIRKRLHQSRTAAPRLHRQSAPELELAVDPERLPAVDGLETNAFFAHPAHRLAAARYEHLRQLGIGPVLGHAAHVIEELLLGVRAEIRVGDLLFAEIRHEDLEILDAVIDATDRARRKAAVAAGLGLRRALQNQHRNTLLGSRESGAKGGVSPTDYDDITLLRQHPTPSRSTGPPIAIAHLSQASHAIINACV